MTLKSFLKNLRKTMLAGVRIYENRIEFDRARAEQKKYGQDDIDVAQFIFTNNGHFTDKFAPEIKLLFSGSKFNREPDFSPIQFYIPFVRIIFMINVKEQISTRIFEENLIGHIAAREAIEKYVDTPQCELGRQQPKVEFKW